jgi:hypothetical protein
MKTPPSKKKFVPGRPGDHRYVHPISACFSKGNAIDGVDWEKGHGYCFPGKIGYASWLAWEALRRNVLFQKYCDEFDPKLESNWDIDPEPYEWGLATFKHYKSNIDRNHSTWPDWIALRPAKVIEHVLPYKAGRPGAAAKKLVSPTASSRRIVHLLGGQVAVIFDLEQIKHFKPVLARQLISAKEQLEAIVLTLRAEESFKRVRTPHEESVIPLLKIADAMLEDPPLSREYVASMVFPKEYGASANGNAAPDAKKFMQKKIVSATDLIYRRGYLALLVKDSPEVTTGKGKSMPN